MAAAKKSGWHDEDHLKRRFARLGMARRLELAEESERFRREAHIVGDRRHHRRAR